MTHFKKLWFRSGGNLLSNAVAEEVMNKKQCVAN